MDTDVDVKQVDWGQPIAVCGWAGNRENKSLGTITTQKHLRKDMNQMPKKSVSEAVWEL